MVGGCPYILKEPPHCPYISLLLYYLVIDLQALLYHLVWLHGLGAFFSSTSQDAKQNKRRHDGLAVQAREYQET